jgi:hypothetical protein
MKETRVVTVRVTLQLFVPVAHVQARQLRAAGLDAADTLLEFNGGRRSNTKMRAHPKLRQS